MEIRLQGYSYIALLLSKTELKDIRRSILNALCDLCKCVNCFSRRAIDSRVNVELDEL